MGFIGRFCLRADKRWLERDEIPVLRDMADSR